MRRRAVAAALGLVLLAGGLSPADAQTGSDDLTRYVDPLIGTYPPGFVNPGPVLPHGMVGVGPDTEGPFNYGGYLYVNNTITGFSHVHMSAGVRRGGQIPVMPVAGPVALGEVTKQSGEAPTTPAYASAFTHEREVAEPGYYAVTLERYQTRVELTATERAALHRYTFPAGIPSSVVFDVSRDLRGYQPASVAINKEAGEVTGHVMTEMGIDVYFAAVFDQPINSFETFSGISRSSSTNASGNRIGGIIGFRSSVQPLHMKVGISYVDVAGARNNLDEIPNWDFEAVRRAARDGWNAALAKIRVDGGTTDDLKSFYTALYHAQLFPNIVSDRDGRYRGFDNEETIHTDARTHYSQFSLWDSYRGQNQLLSVISPEIYEDMVASLLDMYRQAGKLPRWTFANEDPAHMSGDPVIPFIGEAWCRGVLNDWNKDDLDRLFGAMRALTYERKPEYFDETEEDGDPAKGYQPTDDPEPRKVPQTGVGIPGTEPVHVIEGGPRQAGTTLEFGIAEFALALMADSTSRVDDRAALLSTADNYLNLVDPETRWIRPRHADGSWLELFAPENGYGFQEGTSWQYSWLVMHDPARLFAEMGGNEVVNDRLDTFFGRSIAEQASGVWPKVQNQITVFGTTYKGNQYAPGNEHDLQAPFLYNYAGAPWKTQAVAREVISLFSATPDGLPGNDDLGALSGWLVWTMLGIYPMTPGAPLYTVASPIFTRAVVQSPVGDITISAPNASPALKYVTDARVDGESLERNYVLHSEVAGSTLELGMSVAPDPTWAADGNAAPPSLTTHDLSAFGCPDIPQVDVEPIATTLALEIVGKGSKRQLIARLTEDDSGSPVAEATIAFLADGVALCTLPTDTNGQAVCDVNPRYQGGHHTFNARFAGNERHTASEAEVST